MITEYHFEKINFGGSLECLLHSFLNDEQVLLIEPLVPFQLETMNYGEEIKFLGYDNKRLVYKSEMWPCYHYFTRPILPKEPCGELG